MAVVASLRRSGMLTDADLRHRAPEKKPSDADRGRRAVDFRARLR
jgi:hypothetical protein